MRTTSHQSLKEGRINPLAASPQTDRGAGKGGSGDTEKEETTSCVDDVAVLSKACDTSDEEPGGGTRRLVIRGLPLVFLPQHVETLQEIMAAADAPAAPEEAATTAAEVATGEGASAEAPGTGAFARATRPASPTPTQSLRTQDAPVSRPPILNTTSESPAALTARPPSPSEQHTSLQRKHVSAALSGQRRNPTGQGKDAHTASKQCKSTSGGAAASALRAGAPATGVGASNSTSAAVASPAGVAGGASGTVPVVGKHGSRPAVSGGTAAGNANIPPHTDICMEEERERRVKPKGDVNALLRQLICQHLFNTGNTSGGRQKACTCAAVVDLHVFSLLFASSIGLCSKKTALYMSIIAAAVEDLIEEKKRHSLSPLRQLESLRQRIRRQTFDPFSKNTSDSCAGRDSSPTTYPTFSRMEAQKLFKFAGDTFVAHSRLYSYCMNYPRKQIASINLLYTYIPVVPPPCAVTASSLTAIENVLHSSSGAPLVEE